MKTTYNNGNKNNMPINGVVVLVVTVVREVQND